MARTHKLSDLHYVLLATAANRASGSLLPPSSSVKAERPSITRAIRSLISRGFAEEIETRDPNGLWREDGDRRFAAVITGAGRAAIAVADGKEPESAAPAEPPAPEIQPELTPADPPAPLEPAGISARVGTKQALLIEMLQRKNGATLTELAEATAWLPHTTRAALTGLRKRGATLTSDKAGGVTRYRLPVAR
jgi:hypothetical protein